LANRKIKILIGEKEIEFRVNDDLEKELKRQDKEMNRA